MSLTEPDTTTASTPKTSNLSSSSPIDSFVDLETLGLKRSKRIAKNPFKGSYALMLLAFQTIGSSIPNVLENSIKTTASCFQSRKIEYLTIWI